MRSVEFYVDDLPDRLPLRPSVSNEAARDEETSVSEATAEERAAPVQEIAQKAATSRLGTTLSFLAPDAVAFVLLALVLGPLTGLADDMTQSAMELWPLLGLLVGSFTVAGLYHRALMMHPIQELRTAGLLITVIFLVYTATLGLTGGAGSERIVGLAVGGGLAVLFVSLARALSRILFSRADWWGASVLVLASGETGRAVVRNLHRWPEIGFRPVAVVQAPQVPHASGDGALPHVGDGALSGTGDGAGRAVTDIEGVPVIYDTALAPNLMSACDIPYTIVSRPELQHRSLNGLLRQCSRFCRQVFVVPDLADTPALWNGQQVFQGFSGYAVSPVDANKVARFGKRLFDIVSALLGLTLTAPLFLIIAVLTKLNSPGPIFYRQLRIGRKGRCFNVLKFRTMHVDAEERLEDLLQENDALRSEYEKYHKLRNDPRVTRFGAFLRKFSLDELPQLWNVLQGKMSLTGPRAYTPGELSDMGDVERVILQRRPGLSGLWQVSGRNALSFEERTRIDVHYVHHWSFWMDLYILARTLPVVMEQENAA